MSKSETVTLQPLEKSALVEIIITNAQGEVINTVTSESSELAKVIGRLATVAEANGFPIKKTNALVPLGQDIYIIGRELLLCLVGGLHAKTWQEVQNLPKNFPETATYTVVVSY